MARPCPFCGRGSLEARTGQYKFVPPAEIPGGPMVVLEASWEECTECGERLLSPALCRALDEERYKRLGLLSPQQIKAVRENAGLSRAAMASRLGVGEKTYARWESGSSMHNKSSDNLIRLLDKRPRLTAAVR